MTTSTSEPRGHPPRDDDRAWIRSRAARQGFESCGFASVVEAWPASERLAEFLAQDRQGGMTWMATTADRRAHPNALWPSARSAIMLAMNYGPDTDPLEALTRRSRAAISVYAQGRDYHDLIKGRLKLLAGEIHRRLGAEVKVFVDTAPLMEKPLAQRAGLGWQGKHTNLVSRAFGSWLFLGSILTTAELEPDPPSPDHCGGCHACLDICPTGALPAPYQLDARACISYLTIEHHGPVDEAYRPALGNRIYGCDDCLAVCPWNKFASTAREAGLHAREALRSPPLKALLALDDAAFRRLFAANPVKRIGRNRFLRNVLYAVGNSADTELIEAAAGCLDEDDATVREAALWALSRLGNPSVAVAQASAEGGVA
jgi:epoxyqueuosine reductase